MRIIKKIILPILLFISASCSAQPYPSGAPAGFPSPYSSNYYRIGFLQEDSGGIYAVRDTTIRPRFTGFRIQWAHASKDTSVWVFNGNKFVKELNTQDTLPGRFLVTTSFLASQAYLKNITGLITQGSGIAITGSGTIGSPFNISSSGGSGGISQLTGDGTAGPGSGSQVFTLATVNSNVGSFGDASHTANYTVNGKGLLTASGQTSIQIAESQVTNLVSDLAGKQPLITIGSTTQYIRGDGSLATFPTNLASFTNGPGYITGNQSITFTAGGDINGTFTHPTVLTPTLTINANVVTYSKIQAAAGQGLMGAQAAGNFQLITLGSGLSMSSGVLTATGGGGGSPNVNIGSGFRWAVSGTNNIKTFFVIGGTLDSTTNSNAITLTITGAGINQLTGDGTAGPGSGSQVFTLATVNGSPGTFGSATQVSQVTVNGKGLATSIGVVNIQIVESQVTNLITDLAGKQASLSGTGYLKFSGTSPSYLTPTQVTADLNIFTTTLQGLVPSPGSVTGKVLSDNGTWVASGGTGTVTSVAATVPSSLLTISGSPITVSGTLAFGLANFSAHSYLGNNTGSSATPIQVTTTQLTADLNIFTTTLQGLVPAPGSATGKVLSDNGTWISSGGTGTVTSVGASVPSSLLTISGSPVTGSGTLAFGLANFAGHTYWGNNTGGSTTPIQVTTTQLTADLNLFTSSLQGLVPSSGGGTVNFLRADGTWTTPPGGGLSGNGYVFQTGGTTSYLSGSATNLMGYNQSGTAASIVLGPNLSMTGNTLSATGGVPTLTSGHIFVGNAANVATDTVFIDDLASMQQIKTYQYIKGVTANDTVNQYPASSVDSLTFYYCTPGNGVQEQNGGWLSSHATGDSIQIMPPIGVCIGNSIIAGHPWRFGGLESGILSYPDSFGQISWRLSQLTHMQFKNAGWGGQTTAQIRNRFLRDAIGIVGGNQYGAFTKTLTHKPSIIIAEGGINDFFAQRSVDSVEADVEWMAATAAEYQIPFIFLNCVGDGSAAVTSQGPYEMRAASLFNRWLASGKLNQYGAYVVDINSLWNDPTYGNDNIHFSSFVNPADKIHFTIAGYDSVAKLIFRVAKLPVLTKMVFITQIAPANGITNYARPTSATVTGYPNGLAPSAPTTLTLPNNAFDTINITSVIPDTCWVKVATSTTVVGAGTRSGFGPMQAFMDNNPTGQIWYTQKANFAGARTSNIIGSSITMFAPNTNTYSPLVFRRNDNNIGFVISGGASGTSAVLNNNGNIIAIPGVGGSPSFSVGGGISTPNNVSSGLGPTVLGVVSIGFAANATPPSAIGMGLVGVSPRFGIWDKYDGGYGNTDAWVFDNQLSTVKLQSGASGHNDVIKIVYSTADFSNTLDTMTWVHVAPILNQTLVTPGNMIRIFDFDPTLTSLAGIKLQAFRNVYGYSVFNTHGEDGGKTAIGTESPVGSARLDVTSTTRGLMIPRMTATQIAAIGYISSVSMSGGSWTVNPTGITITGGSGAGLRLALGGIIGSNLQFSVTEPGWGFGGGTAPTLSFTGGTGSGGTNTLTIAGPDEGLMVYNTTTHIPQWWDGSAWQNFGGGGGAVSSVSNSDGTLTISPTTGAVVASLALGHANTWSALQTFGTLTTTSTTKFTGLTAGAVTDSILTWNASTGQVNRIAQLKDTTNLSNGLTLNIISPTNRTYLLGGTLTQTTAIAEAGFGMSITGGQFTLGAIAGTRNWSPSSAIPGSIFSFQSGTLNDNVTSTSGTVTNAYVIGISTPTLTATNTGVTTTNAYTLLINAAPSAGANETITNAYALGVGGPAFFQSQILTPSIAFDSWQTSTSGSAATINNVQTNYLLNPSSLIASFTITLPANPDNGQLVKIHFGGTVTSGSTVVTTLTISPNSGQTIEQTAAPITALGGDCFMYQFNSANSVWYREK